MISFFLGTQNSSFFDELANLLKYIKNKKIVIVVPEQYSFQAEKKALTLYKTTKKEVEVLSFSRLSHNILKNFGGITKTTAKKANKIAIINMVLFELKKHLINYGFLVNKPDCAELILKSIEQIKQNELNFIQVEQNLKLIQNSKLKLKANEFWLIFKAYNLKLKSVFADNFDILSTANRTLLKNLDAFSEVRFFFSEFFSFSNLQLQLIETLANRTSLGFHLYYSDKNEEIFRKTHKTIKIIKKIAQKNQIETSTIEIKFKAKKTATLSSIENILINPNFKLSPKQLQNCRNNIDFFAANSIFEEIEWVLLKINGLVKQGCSFSSITILATNLKLYRTALICSMEKFNIPFFIDDQSSFGTMNLIKCCQNLIKAANNEKNLTTAINNILKTDLTQFSPKEIAIFEIYTNIYKIEKLNFNEIVNLGNCSNEFVEQNEQNLKIVKKIQKTLIEAIHIIKNSKSNSKDIALSLISSLEILGIGTETSKISENFKLEWNSLISLLETIYETTKNSEIDLKQFEFLFKSTAKNLNVKQIPPSLNCVLIGSIQETIPNEPKTMFIVGASELSLPKKQFFSNQIFSDADLNKLSELGIDFGKTATQQNDLNILIAYRALCNATENLFLSLTTNQNQFSSNKPCDVLKTLQNFFKIPIITSEDKLEESNLFFEKCITPQTAVQQLALHFSEKTELTEALKLFLTKNKNINININIFETNLKKEFVKKPTTKRLNILSPSQIEQFFSCPFRYFCKYILKIKPIRAFEMNSRILGLAFHHILEKIVSNKNFKKFDSDQIKIEIEKQIKNFMEVQFSANLKINIEFQQTFNPYKKIILILLRSIQKELLLSNFEPTFFEYSINSNSKIKCLKVDLKNENVVLIGGKIDRIDTKSQNETTLIRIIDYKTSDKNLSFSEIIHGLNLQLIIYAMAIENSVSNKKFLINAIDFVKILGNLTTYSINERNPTIEKIEKIKNSGFFSKGLVFLNNTFDQNINSIKNNNIKTNEIEKKVITKTETNLLFKFVENKIKEMCYSIENFEFKHTKHIKTSNESVGVAQNNCSFCPYCEICNPALIETVKHKNGLSKNEFFELVKKEL